MSYRGRSKGNYANQRRRGFSGRGKGKGFQSDTKIARRNFEKRSKRSQVQDLIRMAPLAPNLEVYLKAPNKFDFPNVDTPDPQLIFSHKTPRQQATDLAKIAKKAPVEVWIKNTAKHDIENIDTPPAGKKRTVVPEKIRKFQVAKKEKAKKEAEKPEEKEDQTLKAEQTKTEKKSRKLPTKEEILQRAKEMSMEQQARTGIEPITPEESELKESGLFEQARAELMRGEDTIVDAQVLQYVDQLKAELEPMGFSIVPLSEI